LLLKFSSAFLSYGERPHLATIQNKSKTIILYILTFTLREEHRLRVSENRVLSRIFGPKREIITEAGKDCIMRRFIASPNVIRVTKSRGMRWEGHVSRVEDMRNAYNILVGKPAGKRPVGRPSLRWEDNIRMELKELQLEGVDWMHLAQDKDKWRTLVNMKMNLRVTKKVGNSLTS
jgi:hypothetical protein